jgi:DNA-binding NtrC family response regulator
MTTPSVLVVDDDPSAVRYAALVLEQANYRTRKAENGVDAIREMERELPSLVLSDLRMPAMDGLELLARVKERWPQIPVVVLTVEGDVAVVVEAVRRGAVNYLVKPVPPAALLAAAAKALVRPPRAQLGGEDNNPLVDIVGRSAAIVHIKKLVAVAARSDVNVVITGETGTGKELVSRAIHRLSPQSVGPFVAHNCALLPADMFDSEFFGHRRGAFTGADRDRVGLLRQAHRGVLFLDELECLSPANQAKLLRVLDDGEVRAVGSDEGKSVSVRFLAATNRPPQAMLDEKELRLDLYYRLCGFEIALPPLRERREDISLLAEHFLALRGAAATARALDALTCADWPGNVRQLRNAIHSASGRAGPGPVDVQHLDLPIGRTQSERPSGGAGPPSGAQPLSLQDAERSAILQALETHAGNLSRAAASLGIHRSTLRRKMRWLGVKR